MLIHLMRHFKLDAGRRVVRDGIPSIEIGIHRNYLTLKDHMELSDLEEEQYQYFSERVIEYIRIFFSIRCLLCDYVDNFIFLVRVPSDQDSIICSNICERDISNVQYWQVELRMVEYINRLNFQLTEIYISEFDVNNV